MIQVHPALYICDLVHHSNYSYPCVPDDGPNPGSTEDISCEDQLVDPQPSQEASQDPMEYQDIADDSEDLSLEQSPECPIEPEFVPAVEELRLFGFQKCTQKCFPRQR